MELPIKVKTISKRMRAKLQEVKQQLRRRIHEPVGALTSVPECSLRSQFRQSIFSCDGMQRAISSSPTHCGVPSGVDFPDPFAPSVPSVPRLPHVSRAQLKTFQSCS